jgi:hypothetical protein
MKAWTRSPCAYQKVHPGLIRRRIDRNLNQDDRPAKVPPRSPFDTSSEATATMPIFIHVKRMSCRLLLDDHRKTDAV